LYTYETAIFLKIMCFVKYVMKTLAKITHADVTHMTKVSAHVDTSGWGNRYPTYQFQILILMQKLQTTFIEPT